MDGAIPNLYFSAMSSRSSQRPRRASRRTATVPAYFLYGEPLEAPDERLVHVETVAARSRLHDWVIEPHRHRDLHQVLLIRRGNVRVRLDGEPRDLRSPAAIVVPPGVVHSFGFQRDLAGLVISFAPGLLREISTASPGMAEWLERPAALRLERDAVAATDLWPLADMLLREFGRSASGRQTAVRGLLGALLANLLRVAGGPQPAITTLARDRELVARFRQLAESGFREHRPLARYVAALGTSATGLRRACLAVTGQSPLELLHQRLLVEAERQLRYTSMPVAQVAYYLGYEDPAYFTRFFTRRAGVSPREFRVRDGFRPGVGS
jgi:AraC family transcriptional activator of pobA